MAWPQTVRKKDIKITYYRDSGPGGQHKNKADTACRMVHIPTGLQTTASEQRSQSQNRTKAFERLVEKLKPLMIEATLPSRPQKNDKRIRTYTENRQSVKDVRLNKHYSYDSVLFGDGLGELLQDLKKETTKKKKH